MTEIKVIFGVIGAIISYFYGEPTPGLYALIALMILDYITGILKGYVDKDLNSYKTFTGVSKKLCILILISVCHFADVYLGQDIIMGLAIGYYIAGEGLSIIENSAVIGVPIPEKLKEALEQLKGGK